MPRFELDPRKGVPVYDPDADSVMVPTDYVETCATLIKLKLAQNHFTKNVSVALNTEEPEVAITLHRIVGGGHVLKTNCLEAYIQKMDPEEVARSAVQRMMGELEAGRYKN